MSTSGNKEVEVKIAAPDLAAIAAKLLSIGFSVVTPRTFEANTLWDTPEQAWKQSGEIVRLREFGGKRILTYKGPADPQTKHKAREELETTVADLAPLERVLGRAGLKPIFRYEKYRSEYQQFNAAGTVTLDETPIGGFLELEGEPEWIDETARQLGFSDNSYITKSYPSLYVEYCTSRGLEATHMTFPTTAPEVS